MIRFNVSAEHWFSNQQFTFNSAYGFF